MSLQPTTRGGRPARRLHAGSTRIPACITLLCAAAATTAVTPGLVDAQARGAERLRLTDALDAAIAFHPSLENAAARRASAEERVGESTARRWPNVALQYGVTHFDEPMITSPIHAFDPQNFPQFDETLAQGSLGLRYTLVDWGVRSARIDGATAGVGAADAGLRLTRMQLIERVAAAYLQLGSSRAVDDAAGARVEALAAEVARVERGVEAGTAAEVELLRATTAHQDAIAQRTATLSGVVRAERDLARLMGSDVAAIRAAVLDDPDVILPASAPDGGSPATGAPGPDNLSQDRRLQDDPTQDHPLVARAARSAEAARATVAGERSARLPRLELNGAMLDYGTLTDTHVFEWQVGAQLSWTLFSGGQRRAAVRRAEADLRAAEAEVASRALDVRAAQDAARTSIEAADARVVALETAVRQWEELVRIEQLALDAGAGTQRDLLDAQAGLFGARAGHSQARAEAAISRIRYASARGVLTLDWIQDFTGRSP